MDFSEAVSRVTLWVSGKPRGVEIKEIRESERRLYFKCPAGSFFITVPQQKQDEWGIWSDDERSVGILSGGMEQLFQPSNSLEQVVEGTAKLLETAGSAEGNEGGTPMSEEEGEGEESEGEEEEEFEDYYGDEDFDQDMAEEETPKKESDDEVSAVSFFTGQGSPAAVHRLISDLKALNKSSTKFGISGHPVEDNLFEWEVELSDFPAESLLAKDLERYASRTGRRAVVTMAMKFPKDYPMNPPFVRILRPKFRFLTGHVTIGGSICMQMLTRSGWSPSNDIESILVQIRAEIMSDPNTRLEQGGGDVDYSEHEAKAAFERMVMKYGWKR